ncbi:MAG: hypothetical protein IJ524_04025 [Bacteroidales bacterium]|nr:hypothetical protein [Bacteroidales bacterium]
MMQNCLTLRLLPLLLALASCGIATAQESQWQPFGELTAGVLKTKTATLPTYGATVGLRHGDLTIGLRYRLAGSPLKEAEPMHDLSVLLQTSTSLSPRLELFGGVATGFAIQHSQLLYNRPLSGDNAMAFSAEVNLGVRYYVAENVALTFSIGVGSRLAGDDWRKLVSQLPYDPRTIPTYATAMGGVTIGIPPRVKKINLPPQLIVEGTAPILTAYDNKM